jgi:hypothetical protein
MNFESEFIGHIAETNQRVGDLPKGHQVIVVRPLDSTSDPLLLCESRGTQAFVHLSEIEIFKETFEV